MNVHVILSGVSRLYLERKHLNSNAFNVFRNNGSEIRFFTLNVILNYTSHSCGWCIILNSTWLYPWHLSMITEAWLMFHLKHIVLCCFYWDPHSNSQFCLEDHSLTLTQYVFKGQRAEKGKQGVKKKQKPTKLWDLWTLTFMNMSAVKYSTSGMHGLEMAEGSSVGRRETPGWIAGGVGGGRKLWNRRSVGSWLRAMSVIQIIFFQRDSVSLAHRKVGDGTCWWQTRHSHAYQDRSRQKHTQTDFFLLSITRKKQTPLGTSGITFQEESQTYSLTFNTRSVNLSVCSLS